MVDIQRSKDPELLRQVALIQEAEIRRLVGRIQALTKENAELKGLSPDALQKELVRLEKELNEAQVKAKGGSERRPRPSKGEAKTESPKSGHGPTPQPELATVEVMHHLDAADQICTECGASLDEWEGQTEDSEEVDVVELSYVLKKHKKQKYRCHCGSKIETALGTTKLIPGGRYSLNFAIHVALEKYLVHVPLDRQTRRMARQGLMVTTSALWDQTWALAQKLKGTAERIHQHVLKQDVAVGDETHWKRLNDRKNGFTWVLVSQEATSYKILETRSNESADKMLEGWTGVLVADGYVIYPSQSKKRGFLLAHDWCHVRRRWLEAEATSPAESKVFLDDIGKLFVMERQIQEATAQMDSKTKCEFTRQLRNEHSKPIINAIARRAAELRVIPGTPIANALRYLDRHWKGLIVFLDEPRVPITSNAAERALRTPVLGRRNYLGSRSNRGMEAAGIFYTLIGTCVQNGVDPAKYIRLVIEAELRSEIAPLPHQLKT